MAQTPNSFIPAFEAGNVQIELLERLCNATAVSGEEREVRNIVLEQIKLCVDEVKVDALGNVLATRNGESENRPRVLLAAHMDEVGFMLVQGEEDGFVRFETIGGIDQRLLAGKPVWIGRDQIPGVIGAKPIHLLSQEERTHAIPAESMWIEVGRSMASKVNIGDRGTFATRFSKTGPSLRAKALDNRLGVSLLIELVKNAPKNVDLLAAFTVQEEIGLRGARVAAFAFNPDLAIAVDATPAYDLPSWNQTENSYYNTRLGSGPAIYLADARTISDRKLVKHMVETAETFHIPYQFRQPGGGGTDAGAIQQQREGIPSISISVPCRYTHTPASLSRWLDWQNTLRLLHAALSNITPSLLAG